MYRPSRFFIAAQLARAGCSAPLIEDFLVFEFGLAADDAAVEAADAVFEHGSLYSRFTTY